MAEKIFYGVYLAYMLLLFVLIIREKRRREKELLRQVEDKFYNLLDQQLIEWDGSSWPPCYRHYGIFDDGCVHCDYGAGCQDDAT
jgi:hypothetical protein